MAARSLRRRAASAVAWLLCAAVLVQCGSHKQAEVARADYAAGGAVCGSRDIIGISLPRIRESNPGCGIASPVRVTAVSGVSLSPAAVIDCKAAKALNKWVAKSAIPAFRKTGGGLDGLHVASSYACRTRNSQPGAKLSEHAQGHAIDISAFNLRSGATVTVEGGWNSRADGAPLKKVRKAACGTFGTVLGPGSDRFHSDHFHLDTVRYGRRTYCR